MESPTFTPRRILLLLTCTAIALMTLDARGFGPFDEARRLALAVSSPVRQVINVAVSPISDVWQGAVHYDDVVAENEELRRELSDLRGQVDQLPDVERELDELRAATDIPFVAELERVTGRVISDRRTGLERIVEIDRGSDDDIGDGMPVVTGEGLVGHVVLTTSDRSVIRLVTDPRSSVGVVNRATGAVGVATGDGERQPLILDLEGGAGIAGRARFETSGFGRSRYPGGIPVGTLKLIDDTTTIEPAADLDRLSFLTVLVTEGEPS